MISIQNLTKTYKNGKKALKGISMKVEKGEFMALLGPNGAGKSTTINILGGNVVKSDGSVEIAGIDLDHDELGTKKKIGIVPQEIAIDFFFTVNEVLVNQAGYFGIKDNQDYIDELLHELSLFDKKDVVTRALSGGMKRRLLIAKALVHDPEVIILDEPTAGVDIELRQSLYSYLRKLHAKGKTIILTTHYLEEAEELCDRIVIINNGEIIADQNKETLLDSLGEDTTVRITFDREIQVEEFSFLHPSQISAEGKVLNLQVAKGDIMEIFKQFCQNNIQYKDIEIQKMKLEQVFLKLVNHK